MARKTRNQSEKEIDFDEYKKFDKLIHFGIRLSIMTILVLEESANFIYLRTKTKASDGNLSLNIKKLVEARYVSEEKSFKDKKPLSTYRITRLGAQKYEEHLERVKKLIFMGATQKNESDVPETNLKD